MRVKRLKTTAILIAFSLCILGLAGCQSSKKSDDSVKDQVTQTPKATVEAAKAPEAAATEVPNPTKGTGKTAKSTYEPGTLSAETYESRWLNLRFTPPENVTLATKEQMDTAMQTGKEILSDNVSSELLNQAMESSVYEMMGTWTNGFPNVTVTVENVPSPDMDADEYLATLKKNLEDANLGYDYGDIFESSIAGQTYTALEVSAKTNDITVTQTFNIRRLEDKFVNITVRYTEETRSNVDALMAGFSAIE